LFECDDDGFDGKVLEPSATLMHEIAHILTPNHGHDDAWRTKMAELGQKVEGTRYQKRSRERAATKPVQRRINWAEIINVERRRTA
jgi:hypothetical protein